MTQVKFEKLVISEFYRLVETSNADHAIMDIEIRRTRRSGINGYQYAVKMVYYFCGVGYVMAISDLSKGSGIFSDKAGQALVSAFVQLKDKIMHLYSSDQLRKIEDCCRRAFSYDVLLIIGGVVPKITIISFME